MPDNELLNFNYSSPFSSSSSNIPTTIHFIWFKNLYETHEGGSEIPSLGTNSPDRCRVTNPDFNINIWNATAARELLEQNYAWFLPTYDGYKHPIQRVDAFKYFVLWHYGGIYMDLDVSCRRPLQPLLEFSAWFPQTHPVGVGNDLMAARAQHPVMREIIKQLIPHDRNFLFPYLTVFWSTGPQFAGNVLKSWFSDSHERKEYSQNLTNRRFGRLKTNEPSLPLKREVIRLIPFLDPDTVYILPEIFYTGKSTFFGHRPGGTWHGQDVAVVLWLIKRPWVISLLTFAVVFPLVIIIRGKKFVKIFNKWKSG